MEVPFPSPRGKTSSTTVKSDQYTAIIPIFHGMTVTECINITVYILAAHGRYIPRTTLNSMRFVFVFVAFLVTQGTLGVDPLLLCLEKEPA